MSSIINGPTTSTIVSTVGSLTTSAGTGRVSASMQVATSALSSGNAISAVSTGANVALNTIDKSGTASQVANYFFPANGGTAQFTPGAAFNGLSSAAKGIVSGQGGAELAKGLMNGAMSDLGLKNQTPLAAGAKAAAAPLAAAAGLAGGGSPSAGSKSAAGGFLQYPFNMSGSQDRIQFKSESGKYVVIGLQNQISDQNGVEWSGSTLNFVQEQLAKEAINYIKDNKKDALEGLGDVASNLTRMFAKFAASAQNRGGTRDGLAAMFAEQALGIQGLSARNTMGGQILNPNLELVFTAPTLRPFNFSFRFTSREEAESKNIRKIIRFFKEEMAPRSGTGAFMKRPYYFELKYMGKAADSGSLNMVKPKCALLNCSVDYTPDGSYMTYKDGTMTAYQINLQFQEVEPVTDVDYKTLSPEIIGY